jgi:glycosyltransferase involved in cell wall biosynthesis
MNTAEASIAIVVVCRNALAGLQRTVASVCDANDRRARLYVVDGASTDGTVAYLPTLGAQLAWISEPDAGIYDAMNKGWRLVPSDAHVLYLGAGDLLYQLPTAAELRDTSGQPHPVVLGRCSVGAAPFRSRWTAEMRLRNTAHHQALMVHRSVSAMPPFDISLCVYGDWDFNLRLMKRGLRARHLETLRTQAEPGGVSWRHNLDEIRLVAERHSGPLVGVAAYALNRWSLWRQDRAHG